LRRGAGAEGGDSGATGVMSSDVALDCTGNLGDSGGEGVPGVAIHSVRRRFG
jgi:hypothetical protein